MLSYGLVDALLTELRVGDSKSYYPTSSASTNATSWTSYAGPNSYSSAFCGIFDSHELPPPLDFTHGGGIVVDEELPLGGNINADQAPGLDEYEDVLYVSITPGYELDREDVEHVFSVLGDLKGRVSIIAGNRALVRVSAGQGATIAAILDGHTLNGIPGSLTVNLIDTKLVTPPASPRTDKILPLRQSARSAAGRENNSNLGDSATTTTTTTTTIINPTLQSATTTASSSAEYLTSGVAFCTPPPSTLRKPQKKGLDQYTACVTTAAPPTTANSSNNAIRKWTARYEIQVPTNNSFQVTRKIIGSRGCNMKSINEATGAKLRLRGRGSGYLEGLDNEECEDPLHLCISSCDEKMFTLAKLKVDQLLQTVYQQYYQYAIQNALPQPCLYKIRRKEQFLLNK